MNKNQFFQWFRDNAWYDAGVLTGSFDDYASNACVKYQIARLARPRSICEIGVKCGFSALSLLRGANLGIRDFTGIDNYDPAYEKWGTANAAIHRARAQSLFGGRLIIAASRDVVLPPADLYHLDADHSFPAVLSEIERAFAANPRAVVLLDDCVECDGNRAYAAALEFSQRRGASFLTIPSWRGEGVLMGSEIPGSN